MRVQRPRAADATGKRRPTDRTGTAQPAATEGCTWTTAADETRVTEWQGVSERVRPNLPGLDATENEGRTGAADA